MPANTPVWLLSLSLVMPVLSAVLVAIISTRGRKVDRRHIAEVREQVQNTHTTNLRDDVDAVAKSALEIKAAVFDMQRRQDSMSTRLDANTHKLDTFRAALDAFEG